MIPIQFILPPEFERLGKLPLSSVDKTRLFADFCRFNTLSMIMHAGSGHIGSSFSAMDLVSWIYLNELKTGGAEPDGHLQDVYFSSKGHDAPGLYAILIGLGFLDSAYLTKLRRLNGLPGHPDVRTPHIEANTGSLGMGISKAKGMIMAARISGVRQRCYVLTGDGELQEGQIWESLGGAVTHKMGELTVIVDHNKVQSDTLVEWVSSLGDLEAKFQAFGWATARCDGHDFAAIENAFAEFSRIEDRPKILIADTRKGGGVSFMEEYQPGSMFDLYRYHSGAPSLDDYAKALEELKKRIDEALAKLGEASLKVEETKIPARSAPAGQRLVAAYGRKLCELAETNSNIVALDGDLMLDCGIIPFKERFPDRFIECGIAEQDMVSQAGGLALRGLLPVVHSFACFLTPRPNEQIYNNATEGSKVVYTGSLAGAVPGAPGHSHQSVRDIALLGNIPGLTLLEPCCEQEAEQAVEFAINENAQSSYIRLTSIPCDIPYTLPASYKLRRGQGIELLAGSDAVAIGYGPVLLSEAWHAAQQLAASGALSVKLIALPWLNEVDCEWLAAAVSDFTVIFTLDNHLIHGGQGDLIARTIAELGLEQHPKIKRFGLTTVPRCGQNAEVLKAHRLDRDSLSEDFRTWFEQLA